MPFLKGDNFIISIFRTGLPPCLMHKSTMTSLCVRLIAELKEQFWFHVSNLASWLKVAPVSSTLIPLYITFTLLVPIIFQQNQNGLFLANTQYLLRILWHGVHFCLWTQIQREYTLSADAYRQLALMENVPLQDKSILLSERHGWEVIRPSSSDLFLLPHVISKKKKPNAQWSHPLQCLLQSCFCHTGFTSWILVCKTRAVEQSSLIEAEILSSDLILIPFGIAFMLSRLPCHLSPKNSSGWPPRAETSPKIQGGKEGNSVKEKLSEILLWSYCTVLVFLLFSKFKYFLACGNASKRNVLTHPSACWWGLY